MRQCGAGTYSHGVLINSGGNLASKTGYVVYRCSTMDACIVTDVSAGGQNGSFVWNYSKQPMTGSYVFVDGFTMAAAKESLYGQGVELFTGQENKSNAPVSVHHVWIINSVISGYGQSGIQMNDGEYFYVVHNVIHNNSYVGCAAQGSGISFAVLKAIPGYNRTPDDSMNRIVGNVGSFNNVIESNVVYNNTITSCGSQSNQYNTDGNDIIADTLDNAGSTNVVYPGSLLIALNVVYNGGGRGIHMTQSENVTVANNTCFNSDLDIYDNGTYRPCIGDLAGDNDTFVNNISYAVAGPGNLAYNDAFAAGMQPGSTKTDTFSHNIAYCIGGPLYGCSPMYNGNAFSCSDNMCSANPMFMSVGSNSVGTNTTQPSAANFALQPGSPAIGKALSEPYLPPLWTDIGACASKWAECPGKRNQP